MLDQKTVYLLCYQPGYFPLDKIGSFDPELHDIFENLDDARSFELIQPAIDGEWRRVFDIEVGGCWKIDSTFELDSDVSDEDRAEYEPPFFYIIEANYYYQANTNASTPQPG